MGGLQAATAARRNSMGVTGMGMAASPLRGFGMGPQQAQVLGSRSSTTPSPPSGSQQHHSGSDSAQILEVLDVIRQEVNDGIARLELRLERVERRVNPSMLG